MVTIYSVRHGETTYNREDRVQGIKDSDLTEFGILQAQAVSTFFRKVEISRIYTSPLKRAYETATIIAAENGNVGIEVITDFRELACGKFEDMLIEEIKATCWSDWQAFLADPAIAPENGESMNELAQRVKSAFINVLAAAQKDDNVVIVSHAGVVRMIMAHLMKVSVASAVNFGLSNASIATFIDKYDRWTMLKWNDTDHLGHLEGEVKFVI